MQRSALGAEPAEVRRMVGVAANAREASAVRADDNAAAHAAIATCRARLLAGHHALDPYRTVYDARGKYRYVDLRILLALSGHQAEMLLVDGRCHNGLAFQIAHDAAREHVHPGERVVVVDRMDALLARAKNGDLPLADE